MNHQLRNKDNIMLKLIGIVAVIWAMFHFGIIQLLAIWAMVALSAIAAV